MNEGLQAVLTYLCGVAITGLVGWVWMLWQKLAELRLEIARDCLRREAVDELKKEINGLRDVVYRIALKMDVPVFTEPFR